MRARFCSRGSLGGLLSDMRMATSLATFSRSWSGFDNYIRILTEIIPDEVLHPALAPPSMLCVARRRRAAPPWCAARERNSNDHLSHSVWERAVAIAASPRV